MTIQQATEQCSEEKNAEKGLPKKWLNAYRSLPQPLQVYLQVVAFLQHTGGKSTLAKFYHSFKIKDHHGKDITDSDLGLYEKELKKKELLTKTNTVKVKSAEHFLLLQLFAHPEETIKKAITKIKRFVAPKLYSHNEDGLYFFISFYLKAALYTDSASLLELCFDRMRQHQLPHYLLYTAAHEMLIHHSFDLAWLFHHSNPMVAIFAIGYMQILDEGLETHLDPGEFTRIFLDKKITVDNHYQNREFAEFLFWQGIPNQENLYLRRSSADMYSGFYDAAQNLLQGDLEQCIATYVQSLKCYNKAHQQRRPYAGLKVDLFYFLALMAMGETDKLKKIMLALHKESKDDFSVIPAFEALSQFTHALVGLEPVLSWEDVSIFEATDYRSTLGECLWLLVALWIDDDTLKSNDFIQRLTEKIQIYATRQKLYAVLLTQILATLAPDKAKPFQYLLDDYAKHYAQDLSLLYQPVAKWERALSYLTSLNNSSVAKQSKTTGQKRLAWYIDIEGEAVNVKEESLLKNGTWSKGRNIALKRLKQLDPKLDYLLDQDKTASKAIRVLNYYNHWGANEEYEWDISQLCYHLIGHPAVFSLEGHKTPLEIIQGEVVIETEPCGKHDLRLTIQPYAEGSTYLVEKENPTLLRATFFEAKHIEIARTIGANGLIIPKAGEKRLTSALENLHAQVTVHADALDIQLPEVPASTLLHLHVMPHEDGVKITLLVQPLEGDKHYFKPGHGKKIVIGQQNNASVKITRSLKKEARLAEQLISMCPSLMAYDSTTYEWTLPELHDALQALSDIQAIDTIPYVILWPRGESFKVTRPTDFSRLSLSIKRGNESWFQLTGEITLDEGRVIKMEQLLDHLDKAQGNFIELAKGDFIALTTALRRRLDELSRSGQSKKDGLLLNNLAAHSLSTLAEEGARLKTDKAWRTYVQNLEQSMGQTPHLPSTLHAELRDYQLDGFVWLSRLMAWGAGACLADDMGLGKTIQTIALMLTKAAKGPALVVAPTSVCHNWVTEIERFAPTLTAIILNVSHRKKTIDAAGPNTVIITSYGLVIQEETGKYLLDKEWGTVVLDEAQAIKNPASLRARAVKQLKAQHRIALTGTPIENRLLELWSIFQFVNPGLLGSQDSFNKKFMTPIEGDNNSHAKRSLRQLIHPFILRRTKAMVLQELPPKTEQNVLIEPSAEEQAFYEAMRRRAEEHLLELTVDEPGQRRMHILAQITRLRRACCDPRLVDPSLSLSGSKIKQLKIILQELRDNHHKVLVFSQYVGFLQLVRKVLDQEAIPYQYLDGKTPIKARQAAVDAFQRGEGDVFLISLKAGGMGLNLTAADYVIHLDPWWNPAVEQQASDRAHRIGQQRPVTIYRFILKNTIEERILALHEHKRELADGLLSDAHKAALMNEDELLQLIQGQVIESV